MTLEQHISVLLQQYAPDRKLDEVQVVEIGADDYDTSGLPIVERESLVDVPGYRVRFHELTTAGYAWLNLSFFGLLDERPLVAIEVPRHKSESPTTPVNHSGPSRAVAEAGGDARVAIALR